MKIKTKQLLFVTVFAIVSVASLFMLFASTKNNIVAEVQAISKPALTIKDTGASGNKAVVFKGKPFSFAATGDFSLGQHSKDIFTNIGASGADFAIALGDLVHDEQEERWCQEFVKDHIGDVPLRLVVGNHDTVEHPGHGDIRKIAECLPPEEGFEYVGYPRANGRDSYGIEYYFDHNGLARFIQIAPDITLYEDPDNTITYDNGSTRSQWLIAAIDDARAKGIPWVIVSMHKNCINTGRKVCEIGSDLFNTLIRKKVDLLLQGHEHVYTRTKQMAHTSTCDFVSRFHYDEGCMVKGNTKYRYQKGAGTTLIISGLGGTLPLNVAETDIGFRAAYNGANGNELGNNEHNTRAFVKVTIEPDRLTSEFVPSKDFGYNDRFTIE